MEQATEQAPKPEQAQQEDQPEQIDQSGRMVPVAESIRYRRRAEQAETKLSEVEQQLKDAQSQLEKRVEELATAEAQRDEARLGLTVTENRMSAERLLTQAGVVDMETASLLLSKRVDLSEPVDQADIQRHVEQLLLDKPFLRAGGTLPPRTASHRPVQQTATAKLTSAAQRAAISGNRRDIAEYLRLRRQTAAR